MNNQSFPFLISILEFLHCFFSSIIFSCLMNGELVFVSYYSGWKPLPRDFFRVFTFLQSIYSCLFLHLCLQLVFLIIILYLFLWRNSFFLLRSSALSLLLRLLLNRDKVILRIVFNIKCFLPWFSSFLFTKELLIICFT